MAKIILHGCFGRMGQAVQRAVARSGGFEIAAGVDSAPGEASFPAYGSINACPADEGVVVDFSTAGAVPALIGWCRAKKLPLVLCTTGLSAETAALAEQAAKEIAVFRSANMSFGINLVASLLESAAPALNKAGFDIEIVERHHRHKLDAPSGTAIMLADAMNKGGAFAYVTERASRRQGRPENEIGISAVRGGSIAGDHTVVFAGQDETIEISHSAQSRDVFAEGALKAAQFVAGQGPGLYSMRDLLK